MALADVQTWFFDQLQPGARRAAGPVRGTRRLPAKARVAIYADMYFARLVEALAAEFPRLADSLGPPRFYRLARAYFKAHPSTQPTIQHVGLRLPAYLAAVRRPSDAALARRDQLVSEVYLAPGTDDAELLTSADLRALPADAWPALVFRVTPTLRLVRLSGRTWRFWRKRLDVFEAEVPPSEARALRAALRGKSFAEVCAAAGDATTAATLLATWLEAGLLLK